MLLQYSDRKESGKDAVSFFTGKRSIGALNDNEISDALSCTRKTGVFLLNKNSSQCGSCFRRVWGDGGVSVVMVL